MKHRSEKTKQNSNLGESKDTHTHTHISLPECVPCFPPVVSPVSDLNHKGGLHVYLAAVDDGTVGERTVMPISCLKFYGVDHGLVREKHTPGSLVTDNYGDHR